MPSHFKNYVANFNRVRMSELIDFHAEALRRTRVKPSLVVHPWTGKFYERPVYDRSVYDRATRDRSAV